jgi:transcriptional regulator with XRE-family HTH domain
MPIHSDERRMAALLSDLLLRSGTSADAVESRLGWERGRLNALLAGQKGLTFEALLEILPVLDSTPGDFFAQLCSFTPREAGAPTNGNGHGNGNGRGLDRRFEESRQVVKAAIARRQAWKQQRAATA